MLYVSHSDSNLCYRLSDAVFTRQMKVMLPNSCPLWIFDNHSHFICPVVQDELEGRMVIWSETVIKLWTLKWNEHVTLLIVRIQSCTRVRRGDIRNSYSLQAVFYSPLVHCGGCNLGLGGGDSGLERQCTLSLHIALWPSVISEQFVRG